jgi:hypothetical protein
MIAQLLVGVVMAAGTVVPAAGSATFPVSGTEARREASSQAAPAITLVARSEAGSWATHRVTPKRFEYSLTLPRLEGVSARVAAIWDRRVAALVRRELRYYAKGALNKRQIEAIAAARLRSTRAEILADCDMPFEPLTAAFTGAVYKGRYVSIVLKFTGLNAACGGVGGTWVNYQTLRSLTLDTEDGKFLGLPDVTSNANGAVSTAVRHWYVPIRGGFMPGDPPQVTKRLEVCDRPGNLHTVVEWQRACDDRRDGPANVALAWRVSDEGVHLTFSGTTGPVTALLTWGEVPELR